jgi:HAMP domain-containing protein
MKLSSLSLPNKIALTVFLLICGGLGPLVLYSTVTLQSNLQKLVSNQQFAYVSFVANDLEQKVKLRTQSLQDVADHLPSDKIKDRDAVNQYLESRLAIYRMFSNGVVVIDRDGFGVADHPHIDNRDTADFREREFFKEVLATGKPAIGKPRLGRFTKKLGIGLAVPIRDRDGVIVGVMAGFMGLTDNSIFDQAKAKLGKTGEYVLVSVNDRTIIVDTDNSHTLKLVNAPGEDLNFDRFMSGFEGTAITKHFHIGEALTSANNILDGRWLLLGVLPIEEAFAPIVALEKQIYEVAAGILLAIVGLMWWLVQRLLKPLARATSRISKMDSDGEQQLVLPVESDDEVGKLVKTFNKLHQSLHLSRIELQNQAHTDFLTGLANRRHFLELAELEVTRSIRYGSPLAAFMLDIDLFKKVNDTYGHKVGDLEPISVVSRIADSDP